MVDNEEEATDLEVMRGNLSIAEGNSHLGGEMTTAGKAAPARFEISIDGVRRSGARVVHESR
jgi:hypothetical protein